MRGENLSTGKGRRSGKVTKSSLKGRGSGATKMMRWGKCKSKWKTLYNNMK